MECPVDAFVPQEARTALTAKVQELAAIEADVETMRRTMSKGGKKRGAKQAKQVAATVKGFAGAVPATPATAPAQDTLRQQLKQAQVRERSVGVHAASCR